MGTDGDGFGGSYPLDQRFGLAAKKPVHLTTMRSFPNDNLDEAQCHGDLSVLLQATDIDTVTHALRRVMQATDGVVQRRWRIDGFVTRLARQERPGISFGFNRRGTPTLIRPIPDRWTLWCGPNDTATNHPGRPTGATR